MDEHRRTGTDTDERTRTAAPLPTARPAIVLASRSPRRRELLAVMGLDFEVVPSPLPEPMTRAHPVRPAAWAEALAFFKASSVTAVRPRAVVIGADTVVTDGRRLFGQPADADEARTILSALSGTAHQVITGVAVVAPVGRWIGHEVTRVRMKPMSPRQLDDYIGSGLWQGKAGAYGIQDRDEPFVELLGGSFNNVVGLPTDLLRQLLQRAGVC